MPQTDRPRRFLTRSSTVLYDVEGAPWRVEHAGAWDAPEDNDDARSGCYYEDDERPDGAIPLYRVTAASELGWQDETLDHGPRLRRAMRVLIAAVDAWRGERRDWRAGSRW